MDSISYRGRVEQEAGRGTIASRGGSGLVPCCWTECDRPALRQYQHHEIADRRSGSLRFYFFCSERHIGLWRHSPRDMDNLPSGMRGTVL